jgi:hypothetical protein
MDPGYRSETSRSRSQKAITVDKRSNSSRFLQTIEWTHVIARPQDSEPLFMTAISLTSDKIWVSELRLLESRFGFSKGRLSGVKGPIMQGL